MPIDARMDDPNEDEDLIPSNERRHMRLLDHLRQNDGDLSDSDDEGEGGRRNHASFRDKDRSETNGSGNHKFGIGGGILTSGHANTHGAGPSAHTTAVQILSSAAAQDTMDVDTPPSAIGDANGSAPEPPQSESPKVQATEPAASLTTASSEPPSEKPPSVAPSITTESAMPIVEVQNTPASDIPTGQPTEPEKMVVDPPVVSDLSAAPTS